MPVESTKEFWESQSTEATWTSAKSQAEYRLRYLNEETCTEEPWENHHDQWPSLMLPNHYEPKDADIEHFIIGAVYTNPGNELVAIWTAEKDDGHVEFWAMEGQDDLSAVTEDWCTEIAPAAADIVDDGSGSERDPRFVPADTLRANEVVTRYYQEEEEVGPTAKKAKTG